MPADPDAEIGRVAASTRRGSIVAAAGCGKTEQIAQAVLASDRRRLVLTHTHAGVDALTKRMKKHRVPADKYCLETIAGWCLRVATAFPQRSGVAREVPASNPEWDAVYAATVRLLESHAVEDVIAASYGGCLVDEYQDCSGLQHRVVHTLANQLPTCVFGDPLQAIFSFGGQRSVDWTDEVLPTFAQVGTLNTPWRWRNAGNHELADWLSVVRRQLEAHNPLSISDAPPCVSWKLLPEDPRFRPQAVHGECTSSMGEASLGRLIVIGDSANVKGRSMIAMKLSKHGFNVIEPVSCKELAICAETLERTAGQERFSTLLDFASKCMTGTEQKALGKAIMARREGRREGQAKFGKLVDLAEAVIANGGPHTLVAFLETVHERPTTYTYRREMLFAMLAALRLKATNGAESLASAVWTVQNRIRHMGRRFGKHSVGSTLLVKGLEFERSIVVHSDNMTRNDWYVALTRATRRVRVLSPARTVAFRP